MVAGGAPHGLGEGVVGGPRCEQGGQLTRVYLVGGNGKAVCRVVSGWMWLYQS